jgi:glutathione S-transferase
MASSSLEYKLTYFPIPGRAGAIRNAFALAKIPFVDEVITRPDLAKRVAAKDPTIPTGKLPVLEITYPDGKKTYHTSSNDILRYVGRLGGLYTDDPFDGLVIDELLSLSEDYITQLAPSVREQDEAKQAAMRKELADVKLPVILDRVHALLVAHTTSHAPYLVSDRLTIADLRVKVVIDTIMSGKLVGIPQTLVTDRDGLQQWHQQVSEEIASRLNKD